MRRNLAAALLNEAQQIINNVLKNDPAEQARIFGRGLYRHIPESLERAAELLGSDHFMYDRVNGLQNLFRAYNLLTNTPYPELLILQNKAAIPYAQKALELMGGDPFIYDFLGSLYAPIDEDLANACFQKALQYSPTYASPYNNMGVMFGWNDRPRQKIRSFKKAIKKDPLYFPAYDNLGLVYKNKGNYRRAEAWYQKSLNAFPNALAYSNLGRIYYEQVYEPLPPAFFYEVSRTYALQDRKEEAINSGLRWITGRPLKCSLPAPPAPLSINFWCFGTGNWR